VTFSASGTKSGVIPIDGTLAIAGLTNGGAPTGGDER
jgi:hypothetical protein